MMTAPLHAYFRMDEIPSDFGPSVVTIGNFDGVHIGHRRILKRVCEVARQLGAKPSALTFDPHPTRVLAPAKGTKLLSTTAERLAIMAQCGLTQAAVLPFDEAFSLLTPEQFVKRVLVGTLGAKAVLVGANFHFGHKQAGDVSELRRLGEQHGFSVETIPAVSYRNRAVSSSEVRRLVQCGNVSMACRLLGRPFALEGNVVSGHGIGSKQTVPTLNLATAAEVLPAKGVYITFTSDLEDGRKWPSITNVGMRPTFQGDALTIETYLLAALAGETPRKIRVEFLRWVREERAFPTPSMLREQILRDVGRAQAYFRRRKLSGVASN